jgi:Flp pilus assembly protein TadG
MARRFGSERGAAIIETALTLPILLLVAVGIFEFGRAYQTWQVMTNAAREGARVAVLPNPEATDAAEARAREYLGFGGLNNDDSVGVAITSVPVSLGGTDTAQASKVTITYPFTFMVLQPIAQLVVAGAVTGEPITLTAVSTMRNESQF